MMIEENILKFENSETDTANSNSSTGNSGSVKESYGFMNPNWKSTGIVGYDDKSNVISSTINLQSTKTTSVSFGNILRTVKSKSQEETRCKCKLSRHENISIAAKDAFSDLQKREEEDDAIKLISQRIIQKNEYAKTNKTTKTSSSKPKFERHSNLDKSKTLDEACDDIWLQLQQEENQKKAYVKTIYKEKEKRSNIHNP